MSRSRMPVRTPRRFSTVANRGSFEGSASSAQSRGRRPQCSELTPPEYTVRYSVYFLGLIRNVDIPLAEARRLIARAIDKAAHIGVRGAFAVVGGSGVLVSASNMD